MQLDEQNNTKYTPLHKDITNHITTRKLPQVRPMQKEQGLNTTRKNNTNATFKMQTELPLSL
jgi:hypothetical protein